MDANARLQALDTRKDSHDTAGALNQSPSSYCYHLQNCRHHPDVTHTPPTHRTYTRSPSASAVPGSQRGSPSRGTPPPAQQSASLSQLAAGFSIAAHRASYRQYQVKENGEAFADDMNLHVDGKQTGLAVGAALFARGIAANGSQAVKHVNDYVPAEKRYLIPKRAWIGAFRRGLQEGYESASHSPDARRARKVRAGLTGGAKSAQAGSSNSSTR